MTYEVPPKEYVPPEPEPWARIGKTLVFAAPVMGFCGLVYFMATGMRFGDAVIAVIPLVVLVALIGATVFSFGDKSKLAMAGAMAVTLFVAFLLNQCVGSLP